METLHCLKGTHALDAPGCTKKFDIINKTMKIRKLKQFPSFDHLGFRQNRSRVFDLVQASDACPLLQTGNQ